MGPLYGTHGDHIRGLGFSGFGVLGVFGFGGLGFFGFWGLGDLGIWGLGDLGFGCSGGWWVWGLDRGGALGRTTSDQQLDGIDWGERFGAPIQGSAAGRAWLGGSLGGAHPAISSCMAWVGGERFGAHNQRSAAGWAWLGGALWGAHPTISSWMGLARGVALERPCSDQLLNGLG